MLTYLDVIVYRGWLSEGRKFKNHRVALRAVTGARLLASGQVSTAATAALCTGSTVVHIRAAVVVLRSEDGPLLDAVLRGEISLMKAAKKVRRIACLVSAHRNADHADLISATKILGRTIVPDHAAYSVAAE